MVTTLMRIIKRKIKGKTYNYLQHSFRNKGRVRTAEIYLGKEIPLGIERIKKGFI